MATSTRDRHGRWARRGAAALAVALLGAVGVQAAMPVAAATTAIRSDGPLDRIEITDDLNCAAHRVGDDDPAFFADTACITAFAVDGVLSTPPEVPGAAGLLLGTLDTDGLVLGSVAGTGTTADPYRVRTIGGFGAAADPGTFEQVDSYVVGQESWRTDVTVTNPANRSRVFRVVKAFDCNLQSSDFGFGDLDVDPVSGVRSVGCRAVRDPSSTTPERGDRIESLTALTPGATGFEGDVVDLWRRLGDVVDLPSTCACTSYVDNGVALMWSFVLGPRESRTLSSLTTISPGGAQPLTTAVTADLPVVAPGGADGYTVTIANPNPVPKVLRSLTNVLPDGFAYVPGSTTGARTADPEVDGQRLTWEGPVTVPAAGSVALRFGVRATDVAGTYYDLAGADAGETAVAPAEGVAPIVVDGVTVDLPPTVDAGTSVAGGEGQAIALSGSVTDDGGLPATSWTVTPGPDVDPGASCEVAFPTPITMAICDDDGTFTFTLTADDGVNPPVSDTVEVSFENLPPALVVDAASVGGAVGAPLVVGAAVSDPGAHDTLTCEVEWGDGTSDVVSPSAGRCEAGHTYVSPGVRTARITVTDDDGAATGLDVEVDVAPPDAPPEVTITPPAPGVEGSAATLDATVDDHGGPVSATTWSVTAGPGVDAGASCTFADPAAVGTSITCTDDGTYELRLVADDGVHDPVAAVADLVVANAAPTIVPTAASVTGTVGSPVTVSADVADAGANDSATCEFAWGDGATATTAVTGGRCTASHAYATAGARTVTITASDDDGATAAATVAVDVTATQSFQRISLSFTGGYAYANSQLATSGQVKVVRDRAGVVNRVSGRVTMPGVRAPSSTVTFDITRVGTLRLWYGTVSWRDGTFVGTAPLINDSIRSTTTQVSGRATWYSPTLRQYTLVFSIGG